MATSTARCGLRISQPPQLWDEKAWWNSFSKTSSFLSFAKKAACKHADEIVARWQFHQHFMSSFCAKILSPKNYKHKFQAHKSCAKNFGMQKLLIKYWWNWQSYQSSLRSFYVLTIWVCNFLAKGFWRKNCSENVGEIDTRWQHSYWICFENFHAMKIH